LCHGNVYNYDAVDFRHEDDWCSVLEMNGTKNGPRMTFASRNTYLAVVERRLGSPRPKWHSISRISTYIDIYHIIIAISIHDVKSKQLPLKARYND